MRNFQIFKNFYKPSGYRRLRAQKVLLFGALSATIPLPRSGGPKSSARRRAEPAKDRRRPVGDQTMADPKNPTLDEILALAKAADEAEAVSKQAAKDAASGAKRAEAKRLAAAEARRQADAAKAAFAKK
jgi:hypothetical protein